MRIILIVVLILLSSCSRFDNNEIVIDFIELSNTPVTSQCGCWYYSTENYHGLENGKPTKKLVAVGEAGEDGIYMNINGKNIFVNNWHADYQEKIHKINYSTENYKISILSNVLRESRFSSDFQSKITVSNKTEEISINAFGECGC